MIFEDQTFLPEQNTPIRLDDLLEVRNHFRLFDHMLCTLDKPLSVDMILDMQRQLKRGTSDETRPWMNVGGFKTIGNQIGMINPVKTTSLDRVEAELTELVNEYTSKSSRTFQDLIDFHVRFERIHPFSDGNGRIGRMILFRECLVNGLWPFIILDQNQPFYFRGLRKYDSEPGYLTDTCLLSQDQYKAVAEQFLERLSPESAL
ncbi:Fic family protein [Faecalibaculum rodentium]|uniref:Fic family protein n=1 Tax=Faecalibaculum rodentium TaxID=1702221 RepID=UPI0023F32AEB|nr:Fic family protein [Faecalibaculum rodentium]